MRRAILPALLGLAALPAHAQSCDVDLAAVDARIAKLEQRYGAVISTIGCVAPQVPVHVLMCDAAKGPTGEPESALWQMARLDDLAWLYAVENATGQMVDSANPPRDVDFLAVRDACVDTECLCSVLIDHTNASLGGTSPYPQ